jgi:hypothetical protein
MAISCRASQAEVAGMKIPERSILACCFSEPNWPDAVTQAIEIVGVQKGRALAAKALSDLWLTEHRGVDSHGVALWIRQQMIKQAGNQ